MIECENGIQVLRLYKDTCIDNTQHYSYINWLLDYWFNKYGAYSNQFGYMTLLIPELL